MGVGIISELIIAICILKMEDSYLYLCRFIPLYYGVLRDFGGAKKNVKQQSDKHKWNVGSKTFFFSYFV